AVGSDIPIVSNIDQLGGYAYPVTGFSEATFEHGPSFKLAAYLLDSLGCPLVAHDRSTGNDVQSAYACKSRDDVISNAISNIRVIRVRAHVGKGKESNATRLQLCRDVSLHLLP